MSNLDASNFWRLVINMRVKVGLIGNPNVGKSVVFTNLTGTKQHTGNWPGKTVEKRVGYYSHNGCEFEVVDLPGVYSLSARSEDEKIARGFIVDERPEVVVDIINAAQLERNLYLTLLLIELQVNLVVVLNMYDVVEKQGDSIDIEKLAKHLRAPVVVSTATKGVGTEELREAILQAIPREHLACAEDSTEIELEHMPGEENDEDHLHYHPRLHHHGEYERLKPPAVKYNRRIERKLKNIVMLVSKQKHIFDRFPPRWLALRLFERDPEALSLIEDEDLLAKILEVSE